MVNSGMFVFYSYPEDAKLMNFTYAKGQKSMFVSDSALQIRYAAPKSRTLP